MPRDSDPHETPTPPSLMERVAGLGRDDQRTGCVRGAFPALVCSAGASPVPCARIAGLVDSGTGVPALVEERDRSLRARSLHQFALEESCEPSHSPRV